VRADRPGVGEKPRRRALPGSAAPPARWRRAPPRTSELAGQL